VADEVDITAERQAREEKYLLAAARRPAGPVSTGYCLYCEDVVGDEVRWCSTECRNEWEREAALKKKGGV